MILPTVVGALGVGVELEVVSFGELVGGGFFAVDDFADAHEDLLAPVVVGFEGVLFEVFHF